MDETSLIHAIGAYIGAKELIPRILGPSADELGALLKGWTEQSINNIGRIFRNARRKLGARIDNEEGIHPRVLKAVVIEGAFTNDELSAEYFGGVLASARTSDNRDDRGATYTNILSRLSSYQIRAHYVVYSSMLRTFGEYKGFLNPGLALHRRAMLIYISTQEFYSALDLNTEFSDENSKSSILTHCINGLRREDLAAGIYGTQEQMIETLLREFAGYHLDKKNLSEHGLCVEPTPAGIELFLWAHGIGNTAYQFFLNNDLVYEPLTGVDLPGRVVPLLTVLISENVFPDPVHGEGANLLSLPRGATRGGATWGQKDYPEGTKWHAEFEDPLMVVDHELHQDLIELIRKMSGSKRKK